MRNSRLMKKTSEVMVCVGGCDLSPVHSRKEPRILIWSEVYLFCVYSAAFCERSGHRNYTAAVILAVQNLKNTIFQIHISILQQPCFGTAQTTGIYHSEKHRHDEMTVRTFAYFMTTIGLFKKTVQFIVRVDVRDVLLTGRIKAVRQYKCFFSGLMQIKCKLTQYRCSCTAVGIRFPCCFGTPCQNNLSCENGGIRIVFCSKGIECSQFAFVCSIPISVLIR